MIKSRMNREVHVRLCVQLGWRIQRVISPSRIKDRSPLARVAVMEEMKLLKPTDKTSKGRRELSGFNESESISGPENDKSKRPSP